MGIWALLQNLIAFAGTGTASVHACRRLRLFVIVRQGDSESPPPASWISLMVHVELSYFEQGT